jgi:hypothetical protein
MNDTFTPKIVRWGQRYGAKSEKKGFHIMAYQKGAGRSNNSSVRGRAEGKTYANPKLNSASRKASYFSQSRGTKVNLRYQ